MRSNQSPPQDRHGAQTALAPLACRWKWWKHSSRNASSSTARSARQMAQVPQPAMPRGTEAAAAARTPPTPRPPPAAPLRRPCHTAKPVLILRSSSLPPSRLVQRVHS